MMHRLGPFAVVVAALSLLFIGVSSAGAQPGPTAVAPPCPPPDAAPTEWIDLCIDRGEGATYQVGDPITFCVTAYIPQPATAAPPPPQSAIDSPLPLPLVRVVNTVNGGPERVIFEEAFAGGQRCLTLSIVPPTGSELLRVDAVDQQNGRLIATDQVWFTSVGG
ncbi:MAG: hypothetical protein ACRDJE_00540 [Dehalococcoidia bacterium]